jgi:hypothetical protein
MQVINAANPDHIRAHNGGSNPLAADKIDADQDNGAHQISGWEQRLPEMCRHPR